jgi:hypothetical protein
MRLRSTFGSPDDVIPTVRSKTEVKNPLVVSDVRSSAPTWISSKNLHNPSSGEGVFHFLLDKKSVLVDISCIALLGLIDEVQNKSLLTVSNAGSAGLQHWSDLLAINTQLGHPRLFV